MIELGVRAGAKIPIKFGAIMLGNPISAAVASSGAAMRRAGTRHGQNPQLAGAMQFEHLSGHGHDNHWNLPADEVRDRRAAASIGHVRDTRGSRQRFEQFAGQMHQRANTRGAVGELSGVCLGVIDKLVQALSRYRKMDSDGECRNCQARNRLQVLDRIVKWSALEDGLGHMRNSAAQQDGVAVRGCACDCGSTQRTAATAHVFNDNRAK